MAAFLPFTNNCTLLFNFLLLCQTVATLFLLSGQLLHVIIYKSSRRQVQNNYETTQLAARHHTQSESREGWRESWRAHLKISNLLLYCQVAPSLYFCWRRRFCILSQWELHSCASFTILHNELKFSSSKLRENLCTLKRKMVIFQSFRDNALPHSNQIC